MSPWVTLAAWVPDAGAVEKDLRSSCGTEAECGGQGVILLELLRGCPGAGFRCGEGGAAGQISGHVPLNMGENMGVLAQRFHAFHLYPRLFQRLSGLLAVQRAVTARKLPQSPEQALAGPLAEPALPCVSHHVNGCAAVPIPARRNAAGITVFRHIESSRKSFPAVVYMSAQRPKALESYAC